MDNMINFLIKLIPFFTPIFAMLLFQVNTRLNWLEPIFISFMYAGVLLLYVLNINLFGLYAADLLLNYAIMLTIGLWMFRKKYEFQQAFSVAYCILFINIFFWEMPIYVYTFLNTGMFAWYSQIAPLALFPATFLYKNVGVVEPRKVIILFALGQLVSTLFLIPVHMNGWIIWASETIVQQFPSAIVNTMWSVNRTICYIILAKIFKSSAFHK